MLQDSDSMKCHRGIIASAIFIAFVVMMLATVQLYNESGAGGGFIC